MTRVWAADAAPRAPTIRALVSSGLRRRVVIEMPAAATKQARSTRCGYWISSSAVTKPPIELPTTMH